MSENKFPELERAAPVEPMPREAIATTGRTSNETSLVQTYTIEVPRLPFLVDLDQNGIEDWKEAKFQRMAYRLALFILERFAGKFGREVTRNVREVERVVIGGAP